MDFSYELSERVWKFCKQHKMIENGDKVIVGVSGGADSVCLLFMLNNMRKRLPFTLQVVHVEHGIRKEASKQDAEFVKKLCQSLSIPLALFEIDVPQIAHKEKMSCEEAGRLVRYRVFANEAKKYQNAKIAVAHHMNDQAETVLFHMIRGSGLKGIGGMTPVRENIIRPLLCMNRQEIEQYLYEKKISFCTDLTNQDLIYSRNIVRNKVIPILEEIQNTSVERIALVADEVREAEYYIEHQTELMIPEIVTDEVNGFFIDVQRLCEKEPIIRRYVIRAVLKKLYTEWKDITRTHINAILCLLEKPAGKEVMLPKNTVARRLEGKIFIGQTNKKTDIQTGEITIEVPVNLCGRTDIDDDCYLECSIFQREKVEDIPQNTYTKWFDYDKIKNGLFVRTRRPQDYLCIDQQLKKQKLKDFFINQKIPQDERNKVLLLTVDHQIVWVIGYRISEQFKITEQTKQICRVQIIGGSYHE